MLTEPQVSQLWSSKIESEARACYFAALASRESTVKRWITGGTFVFSSATVVTLLAKAPYWASLPFAILIAIANGYQIAIGQDSKIKTAGKLHIGWLQLEHEYDRLWSHTFESRAETDFERLRDREKELSETAATDIGHDEKMWRKWLDITHRKYDDSQHGNEQNRTLTGAEQEKQLASLTDEGTQSTPATATAK